MARLKRPQKSSSQPMSTPSAVLPEVGCPAGCGHRTGWRSRYSAVGAGLLQLRITAALGDAQLRARLHDPQSGDPQAAIVGVGVGDQPVEHRIVEHRPPLRHVRLHRAGWPVRWPGCSNDRPRARPAAGNPGPRRTQPLRARALSSSDGSGCAWRGIGAAGAQPATGWMRSVGACCQRSCSGLPIDGQPASDGEKGGIGGSLPRGGAAAG